MGEWKKCKLVDVADKFAMGPFGSNIKAENFIATGVPVIRGTNLNYPKYVDGDFVFLSEEKANQLKSSNCFPGDLVFTHRGTLGQVCLIPEGKYCRYVVSQSGMKLSVKKDTLDNHFLFYFFKSNIGLNELLQHEAQVGVPSISNPLTSLKSVNIFLPPLLEQRAIAGVLSSLDDKIDLLHRQNKTLEAMAAALWRKMFVEDADPNWKKGKLENIADNIRQGVSVKNLQDYDHYVGLEHIERQHFALYHWGNVADISSNKSVFQKGDILFGKLRAYFHKVCFTPIEGICSTDILVIRPKRPEYFSLCLMWFFSADVVNYSDLSSGGTRMPRTNWDTLAAYEINIPDEPYLIEFNQRFRPLIFKVEQNIYAIRTLSCLRDTLLPKLMSGEVMVKK